MGSSLLICSLMCGSSALEDAIRGATYSARAWFGPDFPEAEVVRARAQAHDSAARITALAFSGGGVRSYSCVIGQLRALIDMELMDSVDYIGGVSGGAWATSVFTFYRRGTDGVAASDEELLGELVTPGNETLASLKTMPPKTSMRIAATKSVVTTALKYVVTPGIADHT